ncbi:MAG: alpha/beta fold hydrolase [Thermomicrobiales bacterium]
MKAFVAEWEQTIGPVPNGARERWLAGDAVALRAALLAPDRSEEIIESLGSIHVPTLLYAGTDDEPQFARQTAERMPNARFVPLEGLDHAHGFRRSDLVLPHVTTFLADVDHGLLHIATPRQGPRAEAGGDHIRSA